MKGEYTMDKTGYYAGYEGIDGTDYFAGQNLKYKKFDGAVFRKADFLSANLTGASFRGAVLPEANFADTIMCDADFSGAILRNANLRDAWVEGTNFCGADLTGANFKDILGYSTSFWILKELIARGVVEVHPVEWHIIGHFMLHDMDYCKIVPVLREKALPLLKKLANAGYPEYLDDYEEKLDYLDNHEEKTSDNSHEAHNLQGD